MERTTKNFDILEQTGALIYASKGDVKRSSNQYNFKYKQTRTNKGKKLKSKKNNFK